MKLADRFQLLASSTVTRQIDAIGITLCIVLTVGGYLVAARPLLNSRDDRAARETTLTETRQHANGMLANTRALRTQLNNAQTLLNKIEIPLKSGGEINQRLAELTALAAECGLEVQYVRPGASVATARFAQLPIQVSGTGNYRACATFLHRLRERFPDTGLNGFDLSASPADEIAHTSFNFQLQWFVRSGNAQVSNTSSPTSSADANH
jgi:hypothetical protein